MNRFACPTCRNPLDTRKNEHYCKRCETRFPIKNNVHDFSLVKKTWDYVLEDKEKKDLIRLSKEIGYKQAIAKVFEQKKEVIEYSFFEGRSDWMFLLPEAHNTRVLEIGSFMGTITLPLARRFKEVVAVDITKENLEFSEIKAAQEHLSNIEFVQIDPLEYGRLPFPDESFDAVCINGVLEWVGSMRLDLPPKDCQELFLKEVRRILKKSGTMLLGIENRFALPYFLGRPGHSKIPFVDLLPRTLANLVCKAAGRGGYRTYIYSYNGYKRLMEESGFTSTDFYYALPLYRMPNFIIPEKNRRAYAYYVNNFIQSKRGVGRLFYRLLGLLRLEKYLVFSYIILVKK